MWRAPAILVVAAFSALATGLLVYIADRAHAPPVAIPAFALLATGPLFGALGPSLPSFLHPFAFALLTAAARPRSAPPAIMGALAAAAVLRQVHRWEVRRAH